MKLYFNLLLLFFSSLMGAQTVSVDTLLHIKRSIRAISVADGKVYYGADAGHAGIIDLKTKQHTELEIPNATTADFRSIAQTPTHWFVLSAGNPALLYQISKASGKPQLVYQESEEKVFYDSMLFADAQHGFAVGDPLAQCFSFLETFDGGKSWNKALCTEMPVLADGEAAFAASNTNLIQKGANLFIVSGGRRARVFRRALKGGAWEVFETPIVQGTSMSGIFTADFYDANNGFIAGGDYEKPEQNFGNKAITSNAGKTWQLAAQQEGFGYASCIQYAPGSDSQVLASVGATGFWLSQDGGKHWKKLNEAQNWYTIRFTDQNHLVAAGRGVVLRLTLKK